MLLECSYCLSGQAGAERAARNRPSLVSKRDHRPRSRARAARGLRSRAPFPRGQRGRRVRARALPGRVVPIRGREVRGGIRMTRVPGAVLCGNRGPCRSCPERACRRSERHGPALRSRGGPGGHHPWLRRGGRWWGQLTATHTISLEARGPDGPEPRAQFTLPAGAQNRGDESDPAFSVDTPGPVPVTATWSHYVEATAPAAPQSAQGTLSAQAGNGVALHSPPSRRLDPRDVRIRDWCRQERRPAARPAPPARSAACPPAGTHSAASNPDARPPPR